MSPLPVLSILDRAHVMLMTVLSILAVDFRVFPVLLLNPRLMPLENLLFVFGWNGHSSQYSTVRHLVPICDRPDRPIRGFEGPNVATIRPCVRTSLHDD
ncbi:hypothetical protein SCLCIDRAFT_1214615, partial [Scleroderma citrinum Foug A]